jgi:hypothetical protein
MVTELRPFTITFTDGAARINLYLTDKKASQLDGVVGVQPPPESGGKTRVTADLRVRLLSSFGRGELLDLNWKQPAPATQDLKIKVAYPFVLSSQFGVEAGLNIYKKDSLFLDVGKVFGLQFLLSGGDYLKIFVDDKRSTLLSADQYKNSLILPPFADTRKTLFGIGFRKIKLDYRPNPRKGYRLDLTGSAGNRIIEVNNLLKKELYDSLDLKTLHLSGDFSAEFF